VNLTPALPFPAPQPLDPDRSVGAVRPAGRPRDALDADDRRPVPQPRPAAGPAEREDLMARADALVQRLEPGRPTLVNRALNSYADVSDQSERSRLERMLGFDAYA
jgi:hypothetical protein